MKRLYILVFATILLFAGCQQVLDETSESPAEEDDFEIVEIEEPDTELIDGFRTLIVPESTAAELGNYIRANIGVLSEKEAEEMIEYLIIYQTETIERLHEVLYEPAYINALNVTMEGYLNPEKIGEISDEGVRSDYQSLIDGFMTIVRYEETPVVEMDWKALSQYSDSFSNTLKFIVETNAKVYDLEDYYSMAVKASEVEMVYANTESDFLKWQLNKLYREITSLILFGPEGSHMGDFMMHDGEVYDQMVAFLGDYPNSEFSLFLKELNEEAYKDYGTLSNVLSNFKSFGLDSDFKWKTNIETANDISYEMLVLESDSYDQVAEVINETVAANLVYLIKEVEDIEGINVYLYSSFQNSQYATVSMSVSYQNDAGEYKYLERTLTFKLEDGKLLNLEDYIGESYGEFIEFLESKSQKTYDEMPDYDLFYNGVFIKPKGGEGYVPLSLKELLPYVEIDKLYR